MVDQARADETESSQIRIGRVVPTGSHWKRLTKQVQFRASRSTRRRSVRSIEQPRDEVADNVVQPYVVVADEEVVEEVVAEVVQSDVVFVDLIPSVTTDTKVTAHSIEPYVHMMEDFLEDPLIGRCLRSMLTMWHIDYGRERIVSL
ncbi:unnamed protein product [Lathyrus oleraceus]